MAFMRNCTRASMKQKMGIVSPATLIQQNNICNKFMPAVSTILRCNGSNFSTCVNRDQQFSPRPSYKYLSLFGPIPHRSLSTTKLHFSSEDVLLKQGTSNLNEATANKVFFVESSPTASISDAMQDTAASTFLPEVTMAADLSNVAPTLVSDLATVVAEPSLSSLGLVNWTPVGLVEGCLEFLHINMGMPWWVAIVTGTVIARVLMFPIFVLAQKSSAEMSSHMPQMQYLQGKFAEARRSGNAYEASKAGNELMSFMKSKSVNPAKTALIPLMQAPVFISYFFALRSMAKLPVESMHYGGFSWITDLTIPDPYYALPFLACSTMYVIIKIGAESGMRSDNMKMSRYILNALPIIAFPFCINFQSAVLFYWCSNNALTLLLVLMMKYEPIRMYFKIPKRQPIDPKFVLPKKGFVQGFKESVDDQRVLKALENRRQMDEVRFNKFGTGPIPRTYSYDPTKPRPASAAAAARRSSSQS